MILVAILVGAYCIIKIIDFIFDYAKRKASVVYWKDGALDEHLQQVLLKVANMDDGDVISDEDYETLIMLGLFRYFYEHDLIAVNGKYFSEEKAQKKERN